MVLSPALITPLPIILAFTFSLVNRFPNNLALNVPSKTPRNSNYCSFASFLIVSLTSFYQ